MTKKLKIFLLTLVMASVIVPVFASAGTTTREQILNLLKLIAARQSQKPAVTAGALVLGPIVSAVAGPDEIKVNENGQWTLTAAEQQDAPMTYRMDWGDGLANFTLAPAHLSGQHEQLVTFNHTYKKAGKYLITASATNLTKQAGSATFLVEVK